MIEIRSQMRMWCSAFKVGSSILIFLILLSFLGFLWVFTNENSLPKEVFKESKGVKKKKVAEIVLEEEESIWFPLPFVQKQLIYLQHNIRPDSSSADSSIYLRLEGIKEGVIVHPGEKIYLDPVDRESIRFSKEKTPFSIEIASLANKQLGLLFLVQYPDFQQEVRFSLEEKPLQSTSLSESGVVGEMRRALNGARVYPPDLLRGNYGGAEFSKTKGLYRLELKDEVLFLKSGDLFVWKKGKFLKEEKETRGQPLFYVKSIEQGQCQAILWDEVGLVSCVMQFPLVQPQPLQSKMDTILVRLHQRTDSSVTCLLQNKSTILKAGDWLLSSKQGWHNLRSAKELREYLRYALKGELFIFDGIVKNKGGAFFTGHLFDETRAVCQKVELPLKVEPLAKPVKGKKIPNSNSNNEEMKQFPTKGKLKNIVGCNDVFPEEEEGDS